MQEKKYAWNLIVPKHAELDCLLYSTAGITSYTVCTEAPNKVTKQYRTE